MDLPQHWLSPDATDLIRRMVVKVGVWSRGTDPGTPWCHVVPRAAVEDPDARLGCRDFRELEERGVLVNMEEIWLIYG